MLKVFVIVNNQRQFSAEMSYSINVVKVRVEVNPPDNDNRRDQRNAQWFNNKEIGVTQVQDQAFVLEITDKAVGGSLTMTSVKFN